MAKRTNRTPSERRSFTKFCAFWGIVIAVGLLILTAVFNAIGGSLGIVGTILDVIAKVALLIAIALPAYDYVRGRGIGWKITYWVALVLYIVCIVLGVVFLLK